MPDELADGYGFSEDCLALSHFSASKLKHRFLSGYQENLDCPLLPLPALSFTLKSWVILNLGDAFSVSIDPDEEPGQLSQAPRKKRGPIPAL